MHTKVTLVLVFLNVALFFFIFKFLIMVAPLDVGSILLKCVRDRKASRPRALAQR